MAYVSLTTFKAYIQNERTGTANDDRLQAALDSAEVAVNKHCGRSFAVASGSTARVYSPPSPTHKVLSIHDCTGITSVVENTTTLAAGTDYVALPRNGMMWDGATVPYDAIERIGDGRYWYYAQGATAVTVTAAWGWAATPAPVIEATKLLAKDLAKAREVDYGDVAAFGEFGAVRIRSNPQVAALLAPYRRFEAWAGVA